MCEGPSIHLRAGPLRAESCVRPAGRMASTVRPTTHEVLRTRASATSRTRFASGRCTHAAQPAPLGPAVWGLAPYGPPLFEGIHRGGRWAARPRANRRCCRGVGSRCISQGTTVPDKDPIVWFQRRIAWGTLFRCRLTARGPRGRRALMRARSAGCCRSRGRRPRRERCSAPGSPPRCGREGEGRGFGLRG